MDSNEKIEIRWKVTDPQDRQVVLRQSTYENHIIDDHEQKDAAFRLKMENQAKKTVTNPQIIIAKNQRNEYHRMARVPFEEGIEKLKHVKVVVDADRDPNEVVTFIASSKVNDTLEAGSVIYEN